MPFPANTGILQPADFKTVHQIYTEIASEPWFTRDPQRRGQFALSVIDSYRSGQTDPRNLEHYCREIARREFGNSANR